MSLTKTKAALAIFICLLTGMWWLSMFQYSMKWDIMDITLPWNYFISESIRDFELPLWNPFLKNGFPQMGLNDTWYPITWIIALIAGMDVWSMQFDYLLHLFIAGYGMYHYLRLKDIDETSSLGLAVCYMFSGVMISNAQHLGWVIGAAWLPWVFYYFDSILIKKRPGDIIKLALVCSLMFYGSYPPITIIIAYVLILKLGFRLFKNQEIDKVLLCKDYAFAFILFLFLSAVGLTGMLELSPHLNRGGALPLSNEGWGVLTGHLPLQALSSFVIPYAGCSVVGHWGSDISLINCYFGFIPLLIILSGLFAKVKESWSYLFIGVLFFMIALSEVFPFRAWLYHLPLFDRFRFPSLFRLFGIFYLLSSCGIVFNAIQKSDKHRTIFRKVCVTGLFLLTLMLFYVGFNSEFKILSTLFNEGIFAFNNKAGFLEKAFVNLSIQWLVLVSLIACLFLRKDGFKFQYLFVVLEVIMISQFNISETVVHNGDPSIGNKEINAYDDEPTQIDLTKPMNVFNDGAWANELTWFRFNQASITKNPSPGGSSPFSLKTYQEAKKSDDLSLNDHPLLFMAKTINGRIDLTTVIPSDSESIKVKSVSNNHMDLITDHDENTSLVYLQNFYPGWRVNVDGKPVPITKINSTFMRVNLGGGEHTISIEFRPEKMYYAFSISLISFLFVLGVMFYSWLRRGRL